MSDIIIPHHPTQEELETTLSLYQQYLDTKPESPKAGTRLRDVRTNRVGTHTGIETLTYIPHFCVIWEDDNSNGRIWAPYAEKVDSE